MTLIQYTQNQMEFEAKFVQLVESLPSSRRDGLELIFYQRFNKEFELYSYREAHNALKKLIHRAKPLHSKKNWNNEETNYLLYVVDKYCLRHNFRCEQLSPLDWLNISAFIPSRNEKDCMFRYLSLIPNNLTYIPWSSEERQLLLRLIQKQDSNHLNWKLLSQQLYELNRQKTFRTAKQCKEHYACFLKPNLKKGSWTEEEDYQLSSYFLQYGKKWSKLAQLIQGRNQNSIKNRFVLMFQNKRDSKITNADLIKLVKRKKQKLQKKLGISPTPSQISHIQSLVTSSSSSRTHSESLDLANSSELHPFVPIFFQEQNIPQQVSNQPEPRVVSASHIPLTQDFAQYLNF